MNFPYLGVLEDFERIGKQNREAKVTNGILQTRREPPRSTNPPRVVTIDMCEDFEMTDEPPEAHRRRDPRKSKIGKQKFCFPISEKSSPGRGGVVEGTGNTPSTMADVGCELTASMGG